MWNKQGRDGPEPTRLANFTVVIAGESVRCDGVETTRFYDVVATYNGQEFAFSIAATMFDNLDWVAKHLPSGAYICPGRSQREHLIVAPRQLSGDVETRQVFAHSGWVRLCDGEPAYLHGGGALTQDGDREVEVILPPDLAPLHLVAPASNDDLIAAVRASLSAWDVDRQGVTIIAIVAAYRSLLGSVAFSVFLVGPSGVFKTELAALSQAHFGAGFGSHLLPGSWSSTENSLEMLAFYGKDALLVVDDFAPQPGSRQQQTLHSKAERLLRAQGNGSGRGRMNADGTLRLTRPPRGLILSTGEEVPHGHSVRARALIVEVEPNVVNVERLTVAQGHARAGLHAQATYGFARYLAAHYDEIEGFVKNAVERERERALEAENSSHARLPDIVGQMMVGIEMFLRFAQEIGAVSSSEAVTLLDRVRAAVTSVAARQTGVQRDAEPVPVYLDLLRAAISSGRAHLAAPDGREPESPSAWGWRCINSSAGEEWRPQGDRIGYVGGDDLYLVPQAACKAPQIPAAKTAVSLFRRKPSTNDCPNAVYCNPRIADVGRSLFGVCSKPHAARCCISIRTRCSPRRIHLTNPTIPTTKRPNQTSSATPLVKMVGLVRSFKRTVSRTQLKVSCFLVRTLLCSLAGIPVTAIINRQSAQ